MFDNNPNFSCKSNSTLKEANPVNSFESEVVPVSYEIVPKRGYVELWIDGKFVGSFDSVEEARAEVNPV
jgi:hypothetical protein